MRIQGDSVETQSNLGIVYHDQGRDDEAIACQREVLRQRPAFAGAHNALGVALEAQGQFVEAKQCFLEVLRLEPDSVEGYNNLGTVLNQIGEAREAVSCFEQALRLDADSVKALNGLGAALASSDRTDEAMHAYRQALERNPDYAEAHGNIGQLLGGQGDRAGAMSHFERALDLKPTNAAVHNNCAMTMLMLGNFSDGWREYEWRCKCPDFPRVDWPQPRWNGEPLEGRTIVLYPEQGFGDTFQFIRYAPLVKARGGRVLFICPTPLVPFLSGCPGIDQVCPGGSLLPPFDVYAPLLSLPGLFQTDLASIPAEVPYLFAESKLVEDWKGLLGDDGRLRVGINWQGSPNSRYDRVRSFRLSEFAPVAAVGGVRLLSLQKGAGREQLPDEKLGPRDRSRHGRRASGRSAGGQGLDGAAGGARLALDAGSRG